MAACTDTVDAVRASTEPVLDPSPAKNSLGGEPLLRAIGITRRFGTFLANDSIDLDLLAGTRFTPCSARTGPANPRSSRSYTALFSRAKANSNGWAARLSLPALPMPARSASAWCFSIFRCSRISPSPRTSRSVLRRRNSLCCHLGAACGGLARLWPAARSQARGLATVGRRAPAHRDRARADAESQAAHSRRADRGADAAGSGPALRGA